MIEVDDLLVLFSILFAVGAASTWLLVFPVLS